MNLNLELQHILQELTAEDGPNIPARTLAIYCGVSNTTINKVRRGELHVSEACEKQIRKGLREYAALVTEIVNI